MNADVQKVRAHVRRAAAEGFSELDHYLDGFGRFFTPAPLPARGLPNVMGMFKHPSADCYTKSALLARDDLSLNYAEGWALAPDGVPTMHAWCVDSAGRVVDAHWPTPESLTYFGVIVPRAFGYEWRGVFTPAHAWAIHERDSEEA